jgi:chemotaxis protein MotB
MFAMRRVAHRWWLATIAGLALAGCNQNPYLPPPSTTAWQQPQAQMLDLNRRASSLDENNRDLHAQLAQSRQQVQLFREQVTLLQKQLGETAERLQEVQLAKQEADRKYEDLQASTNRRGAAVITANNSLRQSLRKIEIPGLPVKQDGDLIRILLPTDQLFAPGNAQLVGSAFPILDQVAGELARNYPRQLIGIEGHTDSAPVYGGVSNHQLAAAQAIAVFDQLTRRNRLPSRHFFVIAQGANHPAVSNATQAGRTENRRIELIVYPDVVDGS